jgi:hypothetical protein
MHVILDRWAGQIRLTMTEDETQPRDDVALGRLAMDLRTILAALSVGHDGDRSERGEEPTSDEQQVTNGN